MGVRYGYNNQVNPPAPFVFVTLRNPTTGAERQNVPAQVDTAADLTVLPESIAVALGLHTTGFRDVVGFGAGPSQVPVYGVLLGVHTFTPRLLEVLAHPDEPWVLLSRDVLNEIRALLDGPARALEIDDPG
jgi:hypothetical protein